MPLLVFPLALFHPLPFQLSPLTPSPPLPIPFIPLQQLPAFPDQAPVVPPKGNTPEDGKEAGEDVTPITPYSQTSDSYTPSFTNLDFSFSNPSWSGFSCTVPFLIIVP